MIDLANNYGVCGERFMPSYITCSVDSIAKICIGLFLQGHRKLIETTWDQPSSEALFAPCHIPLCGLADLLGRMHGR
jgi:hypothetical protein